MDCFKVMMEMVIQVKGPPTVTRDAGGGTVTTWSTTRQDSVPCLIKAPMLTEQDRFSQKNLVGTVTVATFYSGVQRGDKLVVTTGVPYVGAQLHVTGIEMQPGVSFLGFSDLFHVTAEHVA